MRDWLHPRATMTWLCLLGVTFVSWTLGHGVGIGDPHAAGAIIIAVTFVKVRLVIREFMEVRTAPPWLRFGTDGWLLLVGTVLLVRFLV